MVFLRYHCYTREDLQMNLALIVNQSKEDAESFQQIILQNLSERNIHPGIFLNKDFQM